MRYLAPEVLLEVHNYLSLRGLLLYHRPDFTSSEHGQLARGARKAMRCGPCTGGYESSFGSFVHDGPGESHPD